MTEPHFVPLTSYREYPLEEMQQRAAAFCADLQRRRTVRQFSDRVPEISKKSLADIATFV